MTKKPTLLLLLGAALAACHKAADRRANSPPADSAAGGLLGKLAAMARHDDSASAANAGRDPCALVTRQEAEVYLGPLARDPYRGTTDLAGNPRGRFCVYRTPVGRSILITPDWTDGKLTMKMNSFGQKMMSSVLTDESGKADTLGGEWDDVAWTGGDLIVLKGDVSLDIDVSGSKAGVLGAAKLAEAALPRIAKPLAYDGTKAADGAPGALVAPRDPCSLFPRKDVEAVVGPLTGDPEHVTQGNEGCVFKLPPNPSYLREITVKVLWKGGFKEMNQLLWAAHQVNSSFTNKIMPGGTDAARRDTGMQRGIAKLEQATGAKVNQDKLFTKADTGAQGDGPWDDAAIVAGLEFVAVKKDVMMTLDLRLFSLEKARALVTVGLSHL